VHLEERKPQMAGNTMDAIKKKMQAMRVAKDAANSKAEQLQQQLMVQTTLNEQVCLLYNSLCVSVCLSASVVNKDLTFKAKVKDLMSEQVEGLL